jgi:hypothetical protein
MAAFVGVWRITRRTNLQSHCRFAPERDLGYPPISGGVRAPSLRGLAGREIRHAPCLSPTGYSTDARDIGCPPTPRASAQSRSLVTLALSLRYPLPLAIGEVGTAERTTTCSFADPHYHATWCVGRATAALRLGAIPGVNPPRTRRPDLPGSAGLSLSGGASWTHVPLPPVRAAIGCQATNALRRL